MKQYKEIDVFFALLRAGLWEKDVQLSQFGEINFSEVYRLAEEQSVVGLIAAGIEHVIDMQAPRDIALTFVSTAIKIEQRNVAMNDFVAKLIASLQKENVNALLVKGQGIAQCYKRPLWRACGDIDLFLNAEDYEKANKWISSIGRQIEESENRYKKHIAYDVNSWEIELHGTLRGNLSDKIDSVIDEIQEDTFANNSVRVWKNGDIDITLPSVDNDVIFVFTHVIKHFFRGGIGLRQICDWCRMLWTYRDSLDHELLESRIRKMGLVTEWYAFAALAVNLLGMPKETMPFYSPSPQNNRKSNQICNYIMKVGNFGHNRDLSYKKDAPFMKRMKISLSLRTSDFLEQVMVFPVDAIRAYMHLWGNGLSFVRTHFKKVNQ